MLKIAREKAIEKEKFLGLNTVYVVDDDREVRLMISYLLAGAELSSHPFASGADFLADLNGLAPGCILLDLRMPELDGFEVMTNLARRGLEWPVVIVTGYGDVPAAVKAMKLGAIDFLEKPFKTDALLRALDLGFALLEERREAAERKRQARERIELLTARETEVLQGLLGGLSNKSLADRLGISLRTVEMHRGNMMDRLHVASLAQALTLAMEAGLAAADVKHN
ncbi:MAG: response regulator [Pseudomonadota bacterium]|nr:response regulator [Pseudomonadota bacterium]